MDTIFCVARVGVNRKPMRIRAAFVLLLALPALVAMHAASAAVVSCTPDTGYAICKAYTYSGGDQAFTVPAAITSIRVKVWGAGGGGSIAQSSNIGAPGGSGGYVEGMLAVTPASQYVVMTGSGGGADGTPGTSAACNAAYGFGGACSPKRPTNFVDGGGGGGLSGVFTASAAVTASSNARAVFVAGGGGSGEGTSTCNNTSANSSAAGGAGGNGFAGTMPTMQGQNGAFNAAVTDASSTGGGGGYAGGAATNRLSNCSVLFGANGGSNFIAASGVSGAVNLAGNEAAAVPDYVANNPPSTSAAQYVAGVGVGQTTLAVAGGNGLVVIEFAEPTVVIAKQSVGGVGTFNYTLTGLNNATDSLTTVTPGTTVTSSHINTGTAGTAATLTEAAAAGYSTSISCVDANASTDGVGAGSPITVANGASVTILTAQMVQNAAWTCTFANTKNPILKLQKALAGIGRAITSDQFTLTIAGTNGPANVTTTGTGTSVTSAAATLNGVAGATYTLSETASGTTSLSNYDATITCIDANGLQTGLPNGAPFSGSTTITPVAGAAITCTITNTAHTLSGPAWTCSSSGYLFQSPNSTTPPHTITAIDLATGNPTPVGSTADYVNAIGFNSLDNYFYGWDANSADIVRINADFSLTHLGAPTGVPSTASVMGDFDNAGHLWIGNAASSTHQWAEIDYAPSSPTYGQVLASGTYTNPTGLAGNADWSWINGSLYIVETVTATPTSPNHLVKFNPTTHAMSDLGALSFTTAAGVGATYADANGFLYAQDNNSGAIYRIDPTTLASISVGTGPASSGNDGARCASAPIPTITVQKNTAGRLAGADQFTVSLLSGTTTLTSATTVTNHTTATTTAWPVTQGNTYTIRDAMAAGSTNTLADYTSTISCTDTTTSTPVTPTGSGPDWSLNIPNSDSYTCTVTNAAIAGPAFTCGPLGYLFQASGGVETMYTVDLASGATANLGTLPAGVNGVGYNTLDNYFYGYGGGQIVRINSDRTYTLFGVPAGLPTANAYDSGDFDPAGHLWLLYTGLPTETWAEIDFAPGSPTFGQLLATGTANVAGAFANPGADVSWINGALYSVGEGSAAGNQNYLLKFDPVAHTVTNLGTVGFSGAIIGATYTDGTSLFAADNTTGKIWRINVSTRATTLVTTGPAAGGNDGARCATAPIPTITVKKLIGERAFANDDFTVSLLSGATTLTSATTTNPATTATTTNWPVSMGGTYTIRDAIAAGSSGTMALYNATIACTDDTTSTTVTPGGAAPNWTLNVPGTDSYTCTITNTFKPAATCATSTIFVGQGQPTQLDAETYGSGSATFTPIGPVAAWTYNAISFRTLDNYIYAISIALDAAHPANHLLRINPSTGAITNLGAVAGLPAAGGVNNGAFDTADNYYVGTSGDTAIYKVNLTTLTATAITLAPSQTLGVSDFTYANGFLWGLTNSANPETITRINPVNGATAVFPAAAVPASLAGAAWTLGNGNLGFSDNTTGNVLQVAVTNPSGTPTFTLVSSSSGPSSGNNDGTACIAPPTDLQIVKSGPATVLPNGSITWQLKVTNNGPTISSGYTVTDAVPAGYTAISAAPGCTVVGNAITCTGGTLNIGASAIITVTATAPGTAQCLTNTATVLGNEAEPVGTQANNTSSWQTCIVAPPAIQLNKALSGNRTSDTDQFTVAIHTGSATGPVVNSTTNSTTTGSGATVDPNTGTTGAFAGTAGTAYFLTEAAAGTTNLSNYSATITCTDANGVQTGLPTNAPFAASLAITPVSNAVISCTLTNTSAPIEVSVTKTANTNTLTPGGTIVYTVTASNVGTGDAPNTIVSDSVPVGVASVTWTCAASGGAVCPHASGSGAINETVATFPAGSAVVYTVTATVSANPPAQVANTATVKPPSGMCEPNNTPPPCTTTITVPPVPQTSITKNADTQTLTPSGTIHYTVVVTNTGTVAANNSPVSDSIPTGIASQTWTCVASGGATCTATGTGAISDTIVTFPAGSFVTYTVTATVSATPPAHVINTATVDPPGGVCTPSNTQPPCSVTVTVPPVPQTSVTKTADTQTLTPGGTIHYTVTASNTGSVAADGTLVTDTVPVGIASATWTCAPTGGAVCPHASGSGSINETVATFPVGSTLVYTITATVSSNPPASVANTATTTPPDGGLCTPDNTPPPCTVTITVPPVPQTSITKTADTQALVPGGTIHYTVTASNTGSVSADNSPISDPLPAGIASATWTCVASGGAVCPHASGSGAIAETVATFPAASSLVYTVTAIVSANPPAHVANTATITPPGGVCTPTNTPPPCTTTITVPPVPQTSITKTADANTLTPGGTIHYTIVVANTGSVDADGSPVSDSVPAGIASATWTCVGTGGAVCATNGSGAIADTIDPFPVGSFVTYTVTATISANPPASVANTATVDPPGGVCTPNNTPPPCTDTIVIPPVPQTSVKKTADANTLTPNGTIHYTITVTNTGSVPADNTPVSDPLPNGIASATWTCVGTAGATCAASGSGAITDTIATFPTGSFVTYTVTATISANPPASVSNTVTVNPPGGVCTPDNTPPPCTGTVVVPPVPQVKVTKTADANTLTPNGTIHYTVTVTNTGSVDADGSSVSDPLPVGLSSATWICSPNGGAVCTGSGSGAVNDTIDPFPAGSFVTYTVTATISANPPASVANTASVDPPGGVCTPNDTPPPCTDTVTIPPVPQTSVVKTADTNTLTPSGTIHYTITVTNTGSVAANNTPVSDPVPVGIASATWTCVATGGATCTASGSGDVVDTITTFPPGSFVTYTVTATISANPPASVSNTVTVNPPGGVCTPDNTPPPCTGTVVVPPVPQVKVTKTADTNTLTPNGTIHYTVTVTNTGSVAADGTSVSDPLPTGLASATWICSPNGGATCTASGSGAIVDTIATFPPGTFVTYTVTATISANPPASVANTASVDPPGGVCTPGNTAPPCTVTVTVPPVPQVSVTKTADTNTLTPGGTIHYIVTVANTGSVAANNTPVADPLPTGLASATWICAPSGGATCTASGNGGITDTLTAFPAGSSVVYTVTAIISANPPATVSNTVTVDPPGGVCVPNDTPPPCTVTVTVPPSAQIAITKTADTQTLTPNGTIHYTVTVTNTGSVAADGTLVSDPVPAGITATTWTCTPSGGANCAVGGNGAITDTINPFPAGASAVYTVTATVSANPPATVVNTATASPPDGVCAPDNSAPPCSGSVSVPPVPQTSVKKTADANTLMPNGTIHYTITASNTGSVAAPNTPVSDPLPTGIASATWTCTATNGAACPHASGNGAIAETIATFPAGSVVTYLVTAIVSANPPPSVVNTVTIDPPGGVCTPNDTKPPCTGIVVVPPVPQVSVTKTADTNTLTPNGAIHYTITAVNTGSVPAPNTSVKDAIPTGITAQTWTCAAGGGAMCPHASGSGAINETVATFPASAMLVYTVTATISANPPATVSNTATVDPPGGVCVPGDTTPPCTVTVVVPPVPQVSVTKTSNTTTVTPGGTIVYTVTASNVGAVDAPGTLVSDAIATGIASVAWTCAASGGAVCPHASGSGALSETVAIFPAGSVVVYTLTATVSANPPAQISNTATVIPPTGLCEPNDTPPPCTTTIVVPPLPLVSVTKTTNATTVTPNGTIVYVVTADNAGAVDAPGTLVSDPIPTGIASQTWTCAASGGAVCPHASGSGALSETVATFPAGSTVVYTVTATVSANPPAQVANTATVTPPTGLCEPGNTQPPCTTTIVVPPGPQVSVAKTTTATAATPNGTIVYTVTANNVGAVSAPGTLVSDPIPAGIASQTWTCAASGGAVCPNASGNGALSQTIATFPAGSAVVYTVTATVSANPPASVANTATVTPPNGTCQPNNTPPPCTGKVTLPSVPQVAITKSANVASTSAGGTVVYTVTASNVGTLAAPNTTISDPIPAGIASQTWTCAASGGATCAASGSGAVTDTITAFPPGSSAVYTVTAIVNANPPAQIANTATLTPPQGSVCEPNNTSPPCSAIATVPTLPNTFDPPFITKSVAAVDAQTLRWTIVVDNNQNASAQNTEIRDPIPANMTFVSGQLTCQAFGSSTISSCAFDAINNRIAVDALMQSDLGTANPATATNRIVVIFESRYVAAPVPETNTALACWDPANSTTNITQCQQSIQSTATYTPTATTGQPVSVPVDARWALMLLGLLTIVGGAYRLSVRKR